MPGLIVHGYANPSEYGANLLADTSAPMPSRSETMHLDSVRPKDVPRGRVPYVKDESLSLTTLDIDRAQPGNKYGATGTLYRTGRPEKDEVSGAKAMTHYPRLNRVRDSSLTTADIEGARPNARRFKTPRCVDPLNPQYNLPSHRARPTTPQKSVTHEGCERNVLENTGSATRRIPDRNYNRDPLEHRDIEYTTPGARIRERNAAPARDPFRVVEQAGARVLSSKCHTARATCPLNPNYTMPVATTHPNFTCGEGPATRSDGGWVEGSTPRSKHRGNGEPQLSLVRADIPGAVPRRYKGTVPFSIYDSHEVTPVARHLGLDCSDIAGAQPGTHKPGSGRSLPRVS